MNGIFFAIVLIAFGVAGVRQFLWTPENADAKSPMELLATAMIDSAEASVTLAIGLVGALFPAVYGIRMRMVDAVRAS